MRSRLSGGQMYGADLSGFGQIRQRAGQRRQREARAATDAHTIECTDSKAQNETRERIEEPGVRHPHKIIEVIVNQWFNVQFEGLCGKFFWPPGRAFRAPYDPVVPARSLSVTVF